MVRLGKASCDSMWSGHGVENTLGKTFMGEFLQGAFHILVLRLRFRICIVRMRKLCRASRVVSLELELVFRGPEISD